MRTAGFIVLPLALGATMLVGCGSSGGSGTAENGSIDDVIGNTVTADFRAAWDDYIAFYQAHFENVSFGSDATWDRLSVS